MVRRWGRSPRNQRKSTQAFSERVCQALLMETARGAEREDERSCFQCKERDIQMCNCRNGIDSNDVLSEMSCGYWKWRTVTGSNVAKNVFCITKSYVLSCFLSVWVRYGHTTFAGKSGEHMWISQSASQPTCQVWWWKCRLNLGPTTTMMQNEEMMRLW